MAGTCWTRPSAFSLSPLGAALGPSLQAGLGAFLPPRVLREPCACQEPSPLAQTAGFPLSRPFCWGSEHMKREGEKCRGNERKQSPDRRLGSYLSTQAKWLWALGAGPLPPWFAQNHSGLGFLIYWTDCIWLCWPCCCVWSVSSRSKQGLLLTAASRLSCRWLASDGGL